MNYWLMKSEPDVFGIDHLKSRPRKTEHWDGVRNYQARNMMRDDMRVGAEVFFYHSNCKEPGIVGLAKVVRHMPEDLKGEIRVFVEGTYDGFLGDKTNLHIAHGCGT